MTPRKKDQRLTRAQTPSDVPADVGSLTSLDGWFTVEWDHTNAGLLTWTVIDEDTGARYQARHEDGRWLLAPAHMATVDMERALDPSVEEFMDLIHTLDRAAGRGVAGVHTW